MGRAEELVTTQRAYYELRAPEYRDLAKPSDRPIPGHPTSDDISNAVEAFAPSGSVLELACGDGAFTRELSRYAASVTAIEASPTMLARNARASAGPSVTYIEADIFSWTPPQQYDCAFFGFWLSHVPPSMFDEFWSLVQRCVREGGRVAFFDEDDRGVVNHDVSTVDGVPFARRTLSDGRQFDIVKVFWDPVDLEQRLRSLGWDFTIERVGECFMLGIGSAARPSARS